MRESDAEPPPFVVWLDQVGAEGFAALADELWVEVSALHEGPAGGRDALRASVVSHLPGLRATFGGGERTVPALPSPAREFVELMASADAPLSAILRSYEVGHGSIWSGYAAFLRESSLTHAVRADELETGSIRLFEYMQAMTGQTVVIFNQVRMSVIRERELRRGEILRGVLAGSAGAAELEDCFGYRADEIHIGYVAWFAAAGRSGEVGESVRRRISPLARQHVAVPAGASGVHGWFTPVSATAYPQLRDLELPPGVRIAFGAQRAGIDGFRHTHEEALLSARVPESEGRHICFPDAAVEILTSQRHDLAHRFVEDRLGPLLQHEGRDRLLATLRLYLETSGSPSRCGRRLGVHANTVTQRIQRIEGILGYRIDPEDLALRVALTVRPALPSEAG